MRTRALAFLILAVLIPLNVFSFSIPGIGGGGDKYKPYEDFKKKTFRDEPDFEKNPFKGKQYLEQVYNFIAGKEIETNNSKYPETAKMFDNTAAFLGFYFTNGWRDHQQKAGFNEIRKEIRKTLTEGFLKREVNTSLVGLNNDEVKKQTNALSTLLMAGISYGHIVEPNKYQPQNYKDHKKPYYAFRLGQQAIRDGVLQSYMVYIINLKSEVAWFYEKINKYCPSIDDQKVKLGGVVSDKDFPPIISGSGPVAPVVRGLKLVSQQLAGLGNVECLKLMAQLTQMKIELANMELMLALLSSNYAMLNNQEKEWLR